MFLSNKKKLFLKGTLILTFTGILNRFIGFFYRIFLSGKIGAEGMGIYQLIFPVAAICHSLTIGGIRISISKLTAEKYADKDETGARNVLFGGLLISVSLSILVGTLLISFADVIALKLYQEPRCTLLFQMIALSLPFCAVNSCICGYYYGKKKTAIPAFSQLLEQLARVFSVYLVCRILEDKHQEVSILVAVLGMVFGEFISMLFSLTALSFRQHSFCSTKGNLILKPIIKLSFPISCNQLTLHLLQSAEAILLPITLVSSGLLKSEALSVYGTLTGMALPFILFPSTITNAISTLLLPTIAEADAEKNKSLIQNLIHKTFLLSIVFGFFLTLFFLIFGEFAGEFFFHSVQAGKFIRILSFLCPFLCLATTLESILNGLGKTFTSFLHNTFGLIIRILFVIFCIPDYGITGYLWGILACEILISLLHCLSLIKHTKK